MKGNARRARTVRRAPQALVLAAALLAMTRLPFASAAFTSVTGTSAGWAAGTLSAPTGVSVNLSCVGGEPRAVLAWTASPAPATGYRVEQSGGTSWTVTPASATGTTSGVLVNDGRSYSFTVRATSGSWQSLGVTVSLTALCSASFVGSSSAGAPTANAFVLTVPAGTVAGDVLLALVGAFSTSGGAPPGWSLVRRVQTASLGSGDSDNDASVFARLATASDAGTQVSFPVSSNEEGVAVMVVYRDAQLPVLAHSGAGYPLTNSPTAPSVTPGSPGSRIVMLVDHEHGGSFTAPAGMSMRASGSGAGLAHSYMVADEIKNGSSATGPRTASHSNNDDGAGFLVALAPG